MIETARQTIDSIDQKIIDLLTERYQITKEIGAIKKNNNNQTVDPEREKKMMEKYALLCEEKKLPSELVKNIFKEILKLSYHSQQ